MTLTEFINQNSYVIVTCLWVLGEFFKKISTIQDWVIPFVLTVVGILFGVLLYGVTLQGVTQGILCAGGAVLCDQLIKQNEKRG